MNVVRADTLVDAVQAGERLARAKELGELERQSRQAERSVLDLSSDLTAAKAERDRQAAAAGKAGFRAQFEQAKQIGAGKQQALEAFQRFRAEQQRQAELAQQRAEQREKAGSQNQVKTLERQRQEREAKEQQRKREGNGPDRSR